MTRAMTVKRDNLDHKTALRDKRTSEVISDALALAATDTLGDVRRCQRWSHTLSQPDSHTNSRVAALAAADADATAATPVSNSSIRQLTIDCAGSLGC